MPRLLSPETALLWEASSIGERGWGSGPTPLAPRRARTSQGQHIPPRPAPAPLL